MRCTDLKMVYPFGQHSVTFGYDVSYLPWQRRHSFGAAAKRFTNGLTPNYGLPGGIPPDGIVGKEVRELIDVRSDTCFNEPPNQRNILGITHGSIHLTRLKISDPAL